MSFPFCSQPDKMDCGPTCLRMVAKHYKRNISLAKLRSLSETTREGSSLKNIADAAENIGFRTLGVKIDFKKLKEEAPFPLIAHWKQDHFVVVYEIKTRRNKTIIKVADPAHGLIKYTQEEFITNWIGSTANETTQEGIALLLEPTPKLNQIHEDDVEARKGFSFPNKGKTEDCCVRLFFVDGRKNFEREYFLFEESSR